MPALNTLHDLLASELKDLYNAEKQLIRALPKMARAANHGPLRDAIEDHLEETRTHAERLEAACEELGIKPAGKKCHGMEGLVAEGQEVMEMDGDESVIDAGLIAAAQRVEHYEMAGYGCAIEFARLLGEDHVVALLEETLEEEEAADRKLTAIAEGDVNEMALSAGEDEEEEDEE